MNPISSSPSFSFLPFPLFHSHTFFNFLFSLLTLTNLASSSQLDPNFQACEPKRCRNSQNISYPFYIQRTQPSFCGYPRFELTCGHDGFPLLNTSGTQYKVLQIFYHNQSLRVSLPLFAEQNSTKCIAQARNFTQYSERFSVAPNQTEVLLFYGCDSRPFAQENTIGIGCSAGNETQRSVVALYREDRDLSIALKNCTGRTVNTTTEFHEKGRIKEALQQGFLLNWRATNCDDCKSSGGRCGFNNEEYGFSCYCPDKAYVDKCPSPSPEAKGLHTTGKLGVGLGVGLASILMIVMLLLYKRKRSFSETQTGDTYSNHSSNPDVESGSVYFGIPLFSYKELDEATKHFDLDNQIGDGGFGTVYFGKLKDGREVAVKHLYDHNYRRVEQFMNEIQILTRLRHRNLVSLYGCTSRQSRELLLVYEYIPNGTVASHLHGELAKPGLLPWSVRIKIAVETASALAYLHASNIIHRDVKTNNILLDNSFCVKVADFGLSRLFPNDMTHVSTAPQGTPGYVDPEYYQCYQLTSKSDVYSFGVVLIELISSLPAVDTSRHKDEINLSSLATKKIQESALRELVDPFLGFDSDDEVQKMIVKVAELAFQCLQRDKELRPSMDEVLEVLKRIENGSGVSHGNAPSSSPELDEVGLLRNVKQPSSPKSVTDSWESKTTTPNISS